MAKSSGEQLAVTRSLSPAQKLDASMRLYHSARALKAAYLHSIHPDWTAAEVEVEVRRIFLCHGE